MRLWYPLSHSAHKFEIITVSTLLKDVSTTLLRQIIAGVILLLTSVFVARTLGPRGNGVYAIGILLPQLVSTALNMGLGYSNVYFVNRNEISFRAAFWFTLKASSALAAIGCVTAAMIVRIFGHSLFPGVSLTLLYVVTLGVIPLLMTFHLISLLQASRDFRRYNHCLLSTPGFTLLLSVLHVGLLEQGARGAVYAFVEGACLGLCVVGLNIRSVLLRFDKDHESIPVSAGKEVTGQLARRMFHYGWNVHLSNVLTFINSRVDLFLVNLLLAPHSAGSYIVALNISERLWMLSQASCLILLPRLSRADLPDHERDGLTATVAAVTLWLSICGGVVLILLAHVLVGWFFGAKYWESARTLTWLLPGIIISNHARVVANDFVARNRTQLNLYSALIAIAISVTGNVILIPILGSKGAALTTSLAYLVDGVIKVGFYAQITGNPWWSLFVVNSRDRNALARALRLRCT